MGFVMYQLLRGELLICGAFEEAVERIFSDPDPVDLSPLRDRTPAYIMAVVEKGLQKGPEDGFPSGEAFRCAVEEALFSDLVRFKGYHIQRLLSDVEVDTLAVALSRAPEEITAHMLANIGEEAASRIRSEMADRPPEPDSAHAARVAIVSTAIRLLEEGRIRFE